MRLATGGFCCLSARRAAYLEFVTCEVLETGDIHDLAGMAARASQIARQSPRFKTEAKQLGLRVRALRQARRWTLEQAAEASNLDLKHFQKVEAGKLNLTLVTLVRIAQGFDEPIASLFKRSRSET